MEPIVLSPAAAGVVVVELQVQVVERCGRFSTGIEQLPETAAKSRLGRFSTGIEQLPEDTAAARVGRFSTGIERAELPATVRVGSFVDGYEQIARG